MLDDMISCSETSCSNDALHQNIDDRYFGMHPMMWWPGGEQGTILIFGVSWIITWILVVIVLIALIRWLWKKGNKIK